MDIYGKEEVFPEEFERMFEAIESALGFKLFIWQKHYIMHGSFRKYGASTAQVLRELMQVNEIPIDFSWGYRDRNYAMRKKMTWEIKRQLDEAGVPTREVFFNRKQKEAYVRSSGREKRAEVKNGG